MASEPAGVYVGIDAAAAHLDVAVAPSEGGWLGAKSQSFYDEVSREFFELTTHL